MASWVYWAIARGKGTVVGFLCGPAPTTLPPQATQDLRAFVSVSVRRTSVGHGRPPPLPSRVGQRHARLAVGRK